MSTQSKKIDGYKMDFIAIGISIAILSVLVIITIVSPDSIVGGLNSAKKFLTYNLGFYFVIFTAAMLFYNVYLAASKYGSIRLGRAKPEYSFFGWFAMIFCAARAAPFSFGLLWNGPIM